jgi:hypothetical protein
MRIQEAMTKAREGGYTTEHLEDPSRFVQAQLPCLSRTHDPSPLSLPPLPCCGVVLDSASAPESTLSSLSETSYVSGGVSAQRVTGFAVCMPHPNPERSIRFQSRP